MAQGVKFLIFLFNVINYIFLILIADDMTKLHQEFYDLFFKKKLNLCQKELELIRNI